MDWSSRRRQKYLSLRLEQGLDLYKINGSETGELPMPGSYVIAQDGTITLAFIDPNYTHLRIYAPPGACRDSHGS